MKVYYQPTAQLPSHHFSVMRAIMSDDGSILQLFDNEGQRMDFDVLFTFDNEETEKSYVVYTDDSKDENGNVRVFASAYTSNGDTTDLLPIETSTEWKIIETILNSLQENASE